MREVQDRQLHKDREGHFVTIGAGGISSGATQQFFPIMEAVNEHSDRLPGELDAVRFGGLLEAIILFQKKGVMFT